MSHFTTLVILDKSVAPHEVDDKLAEVLAPWDENVRVPAYRNYIDGSPEGHWSFNAVMVDVTYPHRERWDAPLVQLPLNGAFLDERAKVLGELGAAPVTWEQFVPLSNMRWDYAPVPADNLPATGGESDDPEETDKDYYNRMYYDAELGRAYELSTYNPNSKWDWWTIGGRWSDYFPVYHEAKADDVIGRHLVNGEVRCNGGRKYAVDLDKMLADAITKAHGEYDTWERLSAQHPKAESWSFFSEQFDLLPKPDMDDEEAVKQWRSAQQGLRDAYHAQPLVKAFLELDKESHRWMFDCPISFFDVDREHFVIRHRNAAVPAYALVDKEGRWSAPGEMGWWAMSSDTTDSRAAYHALANQYIADEVGDEDWIVLLDLHI